MALFRIITFLIHAMAEAIASLATAVLTHLLPALAAAAIVVALVLMLCTSCGVGGLAIWRRRRNGQGE